LDDLCIVVLAARRPDHLNDVLESLKLQGMIEKVDVWIDGHQGNPERKAAWTKVKKVAEHYPVRNIFANRGALGLRKMLLNAFMYSVCNYKDLIILEDDCFPVNKACTLFQAHLSDIRDDESIFSVYGSHFLVPGEVPGRPFPRFQGWGWATTSKKLSKHIDELVHLYAIPEFQYIETVKEMLTKDVVARLDCTPPRLATKTINNFFAWDETLTLLTACKRQGHLTSQQRLIYNFGADSNSSRFKNIQWYTNPPFNMVKREKVWDYFGNANEK
jgi:hypothetical protein